MCSQVHKTEWPKVLFKPSCWEQRSNKNHSQVPTPSKSHTSRQEHPRWCVTASSTRVIIVTRHHLVTLSPELTSALQAIYSCRWHHESIPPAAAHALQGPFSSSRIRHGVNSSKLRTQERWHEVTLNIYLSPIASLTATSSRFLGKSFRARKT